MCRNARAFPARRVRAHLHRRASGFGPRHGPRWKKARAIWLQPNALASSLTTGRTKLIGLVSNNFHNPAVLECSTFSPAACRGIRGLRPLWSTSARKPTGQFAQDAAPVFGRRRDRRPLHPAAQLSRKPFATPHAVVHSFGRYTTSPHVHVVGIDNIACGRMAAEALIAARLPRCRLPRRTGKTATWTLRPARGVFLESWPKHLRGHGFSLSYARALFLRRGTVCEMTRRLMERPSRGVFLRRRRAVDARGAVGHRGGRHALPEDYRHQSG